MIATQYEMSNFDHTIDSGMEQALKDKPNTVYGFHSARNFNGEVFFDRVSNKFVEHVYMFHNHIDTVEANSLQELMNEVNSRHGSE